MHYYVYDGKINKKDIVLRTKKLEVVYNVCRIYNFFNSS